METVSAPFTVFIGSGEHSRVEEKTLIYTLRKHSGNALDIRVFNGTANTLETVDARGGRTSAPAPLDASLLRYNMTEYSLYRFIVPAVCGHRGRAVYLDADIICLADIRELAALPGGWDFLAKPAPGRPGWWALGVMLFDCARARFDLDLIFRQIGEGLFTYRDLLWTTPLFLQYHPVQIGELDPRWHARDAVFSDTKLVHYTFIPTQPWRLAGHPHGDTWFRYFNEAREAGAVTETDLRKALDGGHARRDILKGNSPAAVDPLRHWLVKRWKRIFP